MKLKKLKNTKGCSVTKYTGEFNWYIKNNEYEHFCLKRIQENSYTKKTEYFVYWKKEEGGWKRYTANSTSNFANKVCCNVLQKILEIS